MAHWMPLYIGDYLAKTTHLNGTQHGAYLLLIMHQWEHGSLPRDETTLAHIARMSQRKWNQNRSVLKPFFVTDEDGVWMNLRVEEERQKYSEISNKRKAAAQASVSARRLAKGQQTPKQNGSKKPASVSANAQQNVNNARARLPPPSINSSFGSLSERIQPSQELIEHELNTRPRPPGLLATALVDGALARPAVSEPEPSEDQASEESAPPIARAPPQPANLEAKFSRAEVGKPQGWDLGPRHTKPHQLAELGADPPQKPPSKPANGVFHAALNSKEQLAWLEYDGKLKFNADNSTDHPSQWPPGHAA